jgi:hypothetical protein
LGPCDFSTIVPTPDTIENLVSFAGYNTSSLAIYNVNDTVSVANTLSTDTKDFCDSTNLSFMIDGQSTIALYSNNSDFIHFSPPAST